MRTGVALLAIGVSLAGCGAQTTRSVLVTPTQIQPQAQETVTAEPGMTGMNRAMVVRIFDYLESKHPEAKDRLHQLEDKILSLNKQQVEALKALRYTERKDMTLEAIMKQAADLLSDPDKLIADSEDDIDKVKSMSAKDLSAMTATLPPVFKELMDAMMQAPTMAEHKEGTTEAKIEPTAKTEGPD